MQTQTGSYSLHNMLPSINQQYNINIFLQVSDVYSDNNTPNIPSGSIQIFGNMYLEVHESNKNEIFLKNKQEEINSFISGSHTNEGISINIDTLNNVQY